PRFPPLDPGSRSGFAVRFGRDTRHVSRASAARPGTQGGTSRRFTMTSVSGLTEIGITCQCRRSTMKSLTRRLATALAIALLLAPFATLPARAQDFPTRPITLVVPLGAGGVMDVISRVLGQ